MTENNYSLGAELAVEHVPAKMAHEEGDDRCEQVQGEQAAEPRQRAARPARQPSQGAPTNERSEAGTAARAPLNCGLIGLSPFFFSVSVRSAFSR